MTASERTHVDAAAFRSALRHLAGGVAVVTAAGSDGPVGLTVTSLTAASLNPPLVTFSVSHDSRSLAGLRAAEHFAVHLLTADQHELAARFARRGADRFAPPTHWQPGPAGVPVLADAPVRLICAREQVLPIGDHFLVVGSVRDTTVTGSGAPLVYAHGRFGRTEAILDVAGELDGSELDDSGLDRGDPDRG